MAAASRAEAIDLTEDDAPPSLTMASPAAAAATNTADAAAASSNVTAASSANAHAQPALRSVLQQQQQALAFWQPSSSLPDTATAEASKQPTHTPTTTALTPTPPVAQAAQATSMAPSPPPPLPPPLSVSSLQSPQQQQPQLQHQRLPQQPPQQSPQQSQMLPPPMHSHHLPPMPPMQYGPYGPPSGSYSLNYYSPYGMPQYQLQHDPNALLSPYMYGPPSYGMPLPMLHPMGYAQPPQQLNFAPHGYPHNSGPQTWTPMRASFPPDHSYAAAAGFATHPPPLVQPVLPLPAVAPTSLAAYQQTPVQDASRKSSYALHHPLSAPADHANQTSRAYVASTYTVGHHPNQHSKREHLAAATQAARRAQHALRPPSPGTAEAAAAGIAAARSHPGFMGTHAMSSPSPAGQPAYTDKRKHIALATPATALSMRPTHPSPSATAAASTPTMAWPADESPPVVRMATPVSVSASIVRAMAAPVPRRDHHGKHSKSAARRSHVRAVEPATPPERSHKRKQPPQRSAPATDEDHDEEEAEEEDENHEDEEQGETPPEPRSFSLRERPRRPAATEPDEPKEHSTRQRSARLVEAESRDSSLRPRLRHTARFTPQPDEAESEDEEDEADHSDEDADDEHAELHEDEDASMSSHDGPGPMRAEAEWQSLQRRSSAPPFFQPYFPPVDTRVPVHPWMAGLRNPYYRTQQLQRSGDSGASPDNSAEDAPLQQRIDARDIHRYLAITQATDRAATDDWTLPLPATSEQSLSRALSHSSLESAIAADVQQLMEHSLTQLRSRVPEQLAANRARISNSVAQLSAPCAALASLPFSSITRSKLDDMPRSMRTPTNQAVSSVPVAASADPSVLDGPASEDASMDPESNAAPSISPDVDPSQVHAWRIDQSLYGTARDADKPAASDDRKSRELLRSYVFPISLSVSNNPALLGAGGAYISDELARDHTLPERTHYTTVRRNVTKEDDARLHFVPYFGDAEGVTVDVSLYRMGPHDEQSDNDEDVALEDEALQVHTDHVILAVLSKFPTATPAEEERVFKALAAALNNLLAGDSPEPKPKRHGHTSQTAQLAKRRKRDRASRLAKQQAASSEEEPNSSEEDEAAADGDDGNEEPEEEEDVVEEDLFTVNRLRKRWVQLSKQQAVQRARQQSLLELFGCDQLPQLAFFDEFKRTRSLELQQQRVNAAEQKEAAPPPSKKPRVSAASSRASRAKGAVTPSPAAASSASALSLEQEIEQINLFHFKPTAVAAASSAASSSTPAAVGPVAADFNLSRSYSRLFCRRCFVYDCRQHGPSQPRRKDLQLPSEPALNDVEGKMQLRGLSTAPLPEGDDEMQRPPQQSSTMNWPAPMTAGAPRNSSSIARSAPASGSSHQAASASPSPPPPHTPITPQWMVQPISLKGPCGPHCCKHVIAKEAQAESKENQTDPASVCTMAAECSMPSLLAASAPSTGAAVWTEVEKMLLRKLIFIFGSVPIPAPVLSGGALSSQPPSVHAFNFCALANTLGSKTCAEVRAFVVATAMRGTTPFLTHQWMLAQKVDRSHQLEKDGVDADASAIQNKKKRKKKNQHTKAALQQRLRAALRRSMNNLPHAFVPCDHPGVSCADAPNCPCARNMAFCEKYCACDSACQSNPSVTGLHGAHASPSGSSLCPNRFLGCARTCRGQNARCNTRTCPCFAANRECDPDLCGTCEPPSSSHSSTHAHSHSQSLIRSGDDDAGLRTPSPPADIPAGAAAASSSSFSGRSACLNSSIQYRLHKPLLLGESNIHGWGCFLSATPAEVVAAAMATKAGAEINKKFLEATGAEAEAESCSPLSTEAADAATAAAAAASSSSAAAAAVGVSSVVPFLGARKHDLLTEYYGELITQSEADRRGKIYDRLNRSYLFNLNYEFVIDAARKGNKVKFANHSNHPNCYSKIMLVQGDHRIGIYAKRAIRPGEELLFDYQHQYSGPAPEWFLERRKTASKGTQAQAARKSTAHTAAAAAANTAAATASHAR